MGKTIVIMPGGFHPFHAGHLALYQSAQRAFPDAEVYVAATNDTSTRPFPFPVKEKLARLAGVESGHFVQVKSPFRAEEITAKFDPSKDVLIFVRSEKDQNSPPTPGGVKRDGSASYLQPLLGAKKLEPFAKHAYMAYLPTVEFGPGMTSATEIRTAWPQLNEKRKTALVMSLYPKTQTSPQLAQTVVKLLDAAIGTQSVAETINTAVLDERFKHTQVIGNYTYKASSEYEESHDKVFLYIRAYDGTKQIGETMFEIWDFDDEPAIDHLESGGTEVDPEYRNKGIASTMYAYAKMLGNDIRPSDNQRPDGNAMWAAWQKSGAAKHLTGVAEGSLQELANTSLKVKEPKDLVNTNDRKQVTYKVMKFKSGKDTYLINFTMKGPPTYGKKQNYNVLNVAFGVKEKQDDYSFGDEFNTDLTARNKNQFLIYSTVINAIRKFITEYNTEVDEIVMQGAGPRQEAMYQRFFRSAGKYFPGWHHDGKHSLVRDVPRKQAKAATVETVSANATTANTSGAGAGMTAGYQRRDNQPVAEDYLNERRL